jgi:energy-converting hydrogenase Eha subunit C
MVDVVVVKDGRITAIAANQTLDVMLVGPNIQSVGQLFARAAHLVDKVHVHVHTYIHTYIHTQIHLH